MARREAHTDDMQTRDVPDLHLPRSGVLVREAESIVPVETEKTSDQLAELAFNEEVLTIRLERSPEKNAPKFVDAYVNGEQVWIPVGQPCNIKRKFVAVLARAQPYDVQTEVDDTDGDPRNRVVRNARSKYPFSVIRDPSPRGFDWLTKVMQSA